MKKLLAFFINRIPRPWLIRISYVFMKVAAVGLRGDKVECPVCGNKFRKFLPYGYNQVRSNVLCPHCFSLERHRLMWLFLQNRSEFFTAPMKVLHIAPEQCFYRRFREMPLIDYTTADLESPLADIRLDIQDMPLSGNTYDLVICNHVLEHVPDDRKAMREVLRVLKPGGFAILMVPASSTLERTYEDASITDPAEREKHFRQKDHYRLYGKDYNQRLEETGFFIPDPNYLDTFSREEREKFRLPDFEFMHAYYKAL
jgi:SAM-dependent methyltransferase